MQIITSVELVNLYVKTIDIETLHKNGRHNLHQNDPLNHLLMLLQSKHFKGLLVNCRAGLYFVNIDYKKSELN